jgi:HAE1 family hydrophobic/amphiphilic exporter-1
VIPGLYYLFAKMSDGRQLIRGEYDEPLTELFEHAPLPPDLEAEEGGRA